MSPNMTPYLSKMFAAILEIKSVTAAWKISNIFAMSRKGDFAGDLDNIRPIGLITLIETMRKHFSIILTARLTEIIESKPILGGNNLGAAKGKEALDSVQILQSCLEDANMLDKPVQVLYLASLDPSATRYYSPRLVMMPVS